EMVTKEVISEMLGLKNEGENIPRNEVSSNEQMIREWKDKLMWPQKSTIAIEEIIAKMKSSLGLGEKEPPFMEEDDNGFSEDMEGFVWKLGMYIETIGKSKTCFEKTLAIGMEVFPDNVLLKYLEDKYKKNISDGLQLVSFDSTEYAFGSLTLAEEQLSG
ncbi:hypothetical protein Tco_1472341, partial [Tanacetum coccineum]